MKPQGKMVAKYGAEIEKVVRSYVTKDLETMHRINKKLHKYTMELPNKYRVLVQLAQCVLREEYVKYSQNQAEISELCSKKHILTDHAFVRGLERIYGINVLRLKDYVLHDIYSKREFEPVTLEDGQIITIMKKASYGTIH